MDTMVADVLAHAFAHYRGGNVGDELLLELIALGFWYMRPSEPLAGGLSKSQWEASRTAIQHQWAFVFRRIAVHRRGLVMRTYWNLAEADSILAPGYLRALQFVAWPVRSQLVESGAKPL